MNIWTRSLSAIGGRRAILCLGLGMVLLAIANPVVRAGEGTSPLTVLIQFLLLVIPAFVVLFGAVRLPQSGVRPEYYATVAAWTVAAPIAMGGLLLLYDLQPATGVRDPETAVPTLLALATAAGFAAGRYDARARTRERELDERNLQLEAIRGELEQTVDQLEASNERLEQFAYAVSHDLEEPLRTVSSYLQLVESRAEAELSGETEEYLEYARHGADRMREMIEGLLTYSRVETEAQALEPVDLDAVLADVRESLEVRIERSDATVEVAELPTVLGDGPQLRQVFQNLLDNAIEYGGDEPPQVRVWAEPAEDAPSSGEPERWRIAVRDEGVGIPADAGERVFEVFERLHTQEDHEGTGVGLAICKRIVERHDGEIWFDSEVGEGTTVSLTLPAADGGADPERRRERSDSGRKI